MPELVSDLPDFAKLPRSVGGHDLPDFLNAKIIERNIKLPFSTVPERYDFSIKKSASFGAEGGDVFDEGATWFPLKVVHITATSKGISSYRGFYGAGATSLYGKVDPAHELKLSLAKDEYIIGISGTFTPELLTSLHIRTTKKEHSIGKKSGSHFEFNVPKDHHVVGFHGRADDHIRAWAFPTVGSSSLLRRKKPKGPPPEIKPIYSQTYLDTTTKIQWANNNMHAIWTKRQQAKEDLQPIYDNIDKNGVSAWHLVECEGQQYYVSGTHNAMVWSYVNDEQSVKSDEEVKRSIVSIGSYSAKAGLLGISGYIWENLPIQIAAGAIAFAFVVLLQPLIIQGITWGIAYAATQLAWAAAAAGLPSLAALVPASVATAGGLIIGAIIGVAIFLAAVALFDFIKRQYFLTVNVFNFDADHVWKNVDWYHGGGNAEIPNGEWKEVQVAKYVSAGGLIFPPGFEPIENLESVVTYFSISFTNINQWFEGLGIGILMERDDRAQRLALKYRVPRFTDNQMNLQSATNGWPGLEKYYDDAPWVKSYNTETTVGGLRVTGHTPYLSGAPQNAYEFTVNIGLPEP